jgi:aminoglycoside 2'-N-acetyltransferase I
VVEVAHTWELAAADLRSIRALLDGAFDGRFDDADWDHTLLRADRRGRDHGAAVMERLEHVIARAYELGALAAADDVAAFYARRGWRAWSGPTAVLGPAATVRTPGEDGAVLVLPVPGGAAVDVALPIFCDWRDGDVW